MTCRYSEANWQDVLYNSVRLAPGGVREAARHLTERRDRSIHPEALRTRLRGIGGDCVTVEMAELLTEWLEEVREPGAFNWLHALNGRFGMVACRIGHLPSDGSVSAVVRAHMATTVAGGVFAQSVMGAVSDGSITPREAEEIEATGRQKQREIENAIQAARRAAGLVHAKEPSHE